VSEYFKNSYLLNVRPNILISNGKHQKISYT